MATCGVATLSAQEFTDDNWTDLGKIPGVVGSVSAMAMDSVGNLYVGGSFTSVAGVSALNLAKWDGNTWSEVGGGVSGTGWGVVALACDGTDLYVAGDINRANHSSNVDGQSIHSILRWDGAAWHTLGNGVQGLVRTLFHSGTKLYAGGIFDRAGLSPAANIASWDGASWAAIGSGVDGEVFGITEVSGNLYATGIFAQAGGVPANNVAKWNGSAWSALGSGLAGSDPHAGGSSIAAIGTDVYVSGNFETAGGTAVSSRLAKWDGSSWREVVPAANAEVGRLAKVAGNLFATTFQTESSGEISHGVFEFDGSAWSQVGGYTRLSGAVIAGNSLDLFASGGTLRGVISKWSGTEWVAIESGLGPSSTFIDGSNIPTQITAMVRRGGELFVGGSFHVAGSQIARNIARWDGAQWHPLGEGLDGQVLALAFDGADLYAGGRFTLADGATVNHVARWDGNAWHALGSGTDDDIYALAIHQGSLIAGGIFASAGGASASRIARWDGSVWYPLGAGVDGAVRALASTDVVSAPTAALFVGGDFSNAGGATASRLATWDGDVWSEVGGGVYDLGSAHRVSALLLRNDGLYVGGNFTSVGVGAGRVATADIAKWSSNGWDALGPGLDPQAGEQVFALAVEGHDLFVAGSFDSGGSTVEPTQIARWNGSQWFPLGSGIGTGGSLGTINEGVFALAATGDQKLYAGGNFDQAGGKGIGWIAQANLPDAVPRLSLEQPASTELAPGSAVDFGLVTLAPGELSKTFTVRNLGSADLEIAAVMTSGGNAGDFSVDTSSMSASLLPTGATTFRVIFSPGALGARSTTLSIGSNDPDFDPFEITLTGTGEVPDIAVESPLGTALEDGVSTIDFGAVVPLETSSRLVTIFNVGESSLTLSGLSIPPADADAFSLDTTSTDMVVASGSSTSFVAVFSPGALGSRGTTLQILSDDPDESPFEIALAGSGAPSEITVESPPGNALADGNTIGFGSVVVGASQNRTFTVRNDGPAPLSIGAPAVDGAAAADYLVDTTGMAAALSSGASTSFTVAFRPAAVGVRSAALHIPNNDADENPFDLSLSGTGTAPEIEIRRNAGGAVLQDGAGVVDFGNVAPAGSHTEIFTVANIGSAPLNLNASVSRSGSSSFTVNSSGMATVLNPGEDTQFSVTFAVPESVPAGLRTASIRVGSDDGDESDFNIAVSANVIKPEIEVTDPDATLLADPGSFDMGRVEAGESGSARIFTIRNAGDYRLNLSGISIGGANAGEFVADIAGMAASLEPGETTTFSVRFNPAATGDRTALLQVGNDDFQQSPFDITLIGFGNQPEIVIEDPDSNSLTSDSSEFDLGTVGIGATGPWRAFRIRNTGSTTLHLGEIRVTGANAAEFSMNLAGIDTSVTAGGSTTFSLAFSPDAEGLRQATLEIDSDDFDESPFRVAVSGTGRTNQLPEITLLGDNPHIFEAAETYTDPGATATDEEDGTLTPTITASNVDPDRVGSYFVTWSVTDSLSASDSVTRTVQVVDTTPPEIAPPSDIEVDATDADGAAVTYPPATATDVVFVRPLVYSQRSGVRFPIGVTVVTVTAIDLAGNQSSAEFTVTVRPGSLDRRGPRVRILSPGSRMRTVPETFDISGDVFDNFGIASLAVSLNGESLTLDQPAPAAQNETATWSVTGATAENGPNRIEAVATDFSGRVGRAVRTVNYFQIRPELAGYFAAILAPSETPEFDRTGLLIVTVRDNGLFTGRIFIGGVAKPLRGALKNDGSARFFPTMSDSLELSVGRGSKAHHFGFLSFGVEVATGLSGKLSDAEGDTGQELATYAARMAPYSSRNPVAAGFLNQPVNRTFTKGYHTVVLPAKGQTPARDPATYPQGDGATALTLSRTGGARLAGFLADGTRFTAAGRLREDDSLPVFAQLYARKGNLSGELTFANLAESDISGADFLWLRPESSRSLCYPAGWPSGVRIDALGTLYAVPDSWDFGQGPADPDNGNAIFQFSEGGLPSLVTHFVSVDSESGRLLRVPVQNRDILPNLNRGTGWLTGRFRLEDGRSTPFRGVLLSKGANGGGFGYFVTPGAGGQGGGMSLVPRVPATD